MQNRQMCWHGPREMASLGWATPKKIFPKTGSKPNSLANKSIDGSRMIC
jgi:hypothetical protein